MRIRVRVLVMLMVVGALAPSCAETPSSERALRTGSPEPRKLRVALFPYIPDAANDDFKSLMAFIEEEFETANKSIDLQLRPLDPNNADAPFYDPNTVAEWLTGPRDSGYDLVEVDMVLLDQLTRNAIQPWEPSALPSQDWLPAALEATHVAGTTWAYPRFVCGHFLFTRDDAIADADSVMDLVKAVGGAPTGRLVGDFGGSWNLPSLFLDAFADMYGAQRVADGMRVPLETTTRDVFVKIAHLCAAPSSTECTDAFHNDRHAAADVFAAGDAAAYVGYMAAHR